MKVFILSATNVVIKQKQGQVKQHVEQEHEGVYYNCEQCIYKGKTKTHVKQHVEAQHEGLLYNCNQCEYKNKWKGALKIHMQTKHEY